MEYVLKSSAIIIVFYSCYKLLLQRDTFFQTNRWYFLSGVIVSILLPLVVIPIYVSRAPVNTTFIIQQTTSMLNPATNETPFNWNLLLTVVYILGASVFSIRLGIQFFSLTSLILRHKKYRVGKYIHVYVKDNISPFSFFNWIVINPSQFQDEELNQIFIHEKVHVKQHHSLDLLLMQIATVLFWFNPFIWLYKKALEQNLEFIADNQTQKKTSCEKSYQKLLLKTSVPNYQMAFTNNFYNSLIKNRIVMLHTSKSHKKNQLKILVLVPILALFLLSFSTKKVYTKEASNSNLNTSKKGDITMILISKKTSDDDLDKTVAEFKASDVDLKFSNLKRNDKGEIIKISISASSKHSKAKFEADSDKPISPITIEYNSEDDSISIGSTNSNGFTFKSKDGKHRIKTTGEGSNVFIHRSHSDDDDFKEIIQDEDKVIVRSNSNTKVIRKNSGSSFQIISDDDSGDVHEEVIEINNGHSNGLHINFGRNENPLILLDGKEISKKEMEALDSDTIKTMEVIKDDSNVKKYGKKAKDGVVIITSKDKG